MKIAIVGVGLTGLSAAYDLMSLGHSVTLYEAGTQLGGLAAGFKDPAWDWSLESYYHHIFTSDSAILALVAELKLQDLVLFRRPVTVSAYQNHFFPLDTPQAILRFPGLTLAEKFRFAAVTAYLKYLASWQPLEHVTAHAWLNRWYGKKIYQKIWEPLLKGKFGPYGRQVNMAWMWARLKARTPQLGSFHGGFQNFVNRFAGILKTRGVVIHTTMAVRSIKKLSDGRLELQVNNRHFAYDRVLLTTSPLLTAKLVPGLPAGYRHQLESLVHLGALIIILALKQPLSPQGYYWHNLPKTKKLPFLALVEHTNFMSASQYGGDHLVYCGDYVLPHDPRLRATKADIVSSCLPVLKLINPDFDRSWIRKSWVNRTFYAQPVPFINHSRHVPPLTTPIPGLFLANMSQVYPWDRGTNYAVDLGRRVAKLIVKSNS